MCLSRQKNYKHYVDLEEDVIAIDDRNNRCSVCGGDFKHTKKYFMTETTPEGLKEVVFKTAHNGCLKIMARIKQKRQEIMDLEFQIYCKHSTADIN
jgi:hypothetical protein